MRRFHLMCLATSLFLSFLSCSLDDGPQVRYMPLQILSANLPEVFELNETYEITVDYIIPNDCTGFSGFDVTKGDTTTRNVVIFGVERTDQENCAETDNENQASFDFLVLYDEPYIFRFWQGESDDVEENYFEVIVPVNNN